MSVAHDVVRRQRFEQEARAVAALNHPNIVMAIESACIPPQQSRQFTDPQPRKCRHIRHRGVRLREQLQQIMELVDE